MDRIILSDVSPELIVNIQIVKKKLSTTNISVSEIFKLKHLLGMSDAVAIELFNLK